MIPGSARRSRVRPPRSLRGPAETLDLPTESRSRYTLARVHAEGGLGRVWLAHDTDLHREVALKEIKRDRAQNPDTRSRFLKEAQITGQLEHPNIVPVYELGRRPEDNQPFYTMRFIRGRTLREAIAGYHQRRSQGQDDRLEFQKLLTALVAVCQAIGYAHSRGVIHRDLKPENIVLGSFGEVIVLDWGLAKLVSETGKTARSEDAGRVSLSADAGEHRTIGLIGTPAYMAPEQADARHDLVDERTDIYGLGAILFEILTGRPPIEAGTVTELISKVSSGATRQARAVVATVPAPLDAICARAMATARVRALCPGDRPGRRDPALDRRRAGRGLSRRMDHPGRALGTETQDGRQLRGRTPDRECHRPGDL